MDVLLQKFLIGLLAGRTNKLLTKFLNNNTVEAAINKAFDLALKEYDPNPTLAIIDRLKFKNALSTLEGTLQSDQGVSLAADQERFLVIFYRKLMEQPLAWNYLQSTYFKKQGDSLVLIEDNVQSALSSIQALQETIDRIEDHLLRVSTTVSPTTENYPIYLSSHRHPPLATHKVLGREQALTTMRDKLQSDGRLLLLNGIGGVGKTTMAGYYMSKFEQQYKHIAWVTYNGGFQKSFTSDLQDYLGLKANNNEDEQYHLIVKILSEKEGPNLLIIDNINTQAEIEEIATFDTRLPTGWHVILTSRAKHDAFDTQVLGVLDMHYAKQLFLTKYTLKKEETEDDLEALLQQVGRHTLVVEMLSKTLSLHGWSIQAIQEKIKEKGLSSIDDKVTVTTAHSKHKQALLSDYVSSLFDYNLEKLSEEERYIIHMLAAMPSVAHNPEILGPLIGSSENNYSIFPVLSTLERKGFLDKTQDAEEAKTYFYLHPVLKDVLRSRWDFNYANLQQFGERLANILDLKLSLVASLFRYGQEFIQHFEDPRFHKLYYSLVTKYKELGLLGKALTLLVKAIEGAMAENDLWAIASYKYKGGTMLMQIGQYEAAISLYSDAWKGFEKVATDTDTEKYQSLKSPAMVNYVISIQRIGGALIELKKLDEASKMIENTSTGLQTLLDTVEGLNEKQVGSLKRAQAENYQFLGRIRKEQGKLSEAILAFEQMKKICEEAVELKENDFESRKFLGASYFKLGEVYELKKAHEKALSCFEQQHLIYQSLYQEFPFSEETKYGLSVALEKLGVTHFILGSQTKALGYFKEKLGMAKELFKINPFAVDVRHSLAVAHQNLSVSYSSTGERELARKHLKEANEVMEKLVLDHPANTQYKQELEANKTRLERL